MTSVMVDDQTPSPPADRHARRGRGSVSTKLVLGTAAAVLVVLVVYPLFWLVLGSLGGTDTFTFSNYLRVVSDPGLYDALINTLLIATGACVISLLTGVPIAWLISRTNIPGKGLLRMLTSVSFMIPGFLGALAYVMLMAPNNGWLNRLVVSVTGSERGPFNIYSLAGITMVTSFGVMAYVVMLTSAALDSVDSGLEQSARILGASRWKILMGITLPLVTPALLASALLVFVQSLALFGSHAILGLPVQIYTLPTRIYSLFAFPPDYGAATALSMMLVLLTVGCLYLQRWVLARRSYITTGGKAGVHETHDLGRLKWPALIGCHAFFALAVYFPVGVLLLTSLMTAQGSGLTLENFTFDNYVAVLFESSLTQRAATNSLIVAGSAATLGVLLGALIAYINFRLKPRGAKILDYLATIPLGLPGIVLAVGLVLAWIRLPVAVYGTLAILLIAYLTRYIPLGVRSADSALRQIDPSLEEAGRISGGSWLRSMAEITLPLMKGGLVAGWSLIFVQAIGELAVAIMLFTAGTETIAVAIYQRSEEGHFEEVAALSVIVLIATALILGLTRRLTRASVTRF
jgi:iron(III) transport system permease protein